ncbi:MAG: hypothetical protein AAFW70_15745 [Cyanobacteria bacterium J06635_10]
MEKKQKSRVTGGNNATRIAVWLWVLPGLKLSAITQKMCGGEYLGNQFDAEKESGRSIRLIRARIAAKAVKLLFKKLVKKYAGS